MRSLLQLGGVVLATLSTACAPSVRPGPTLRAIYALPPVDHLDRAHTALILVDFQDEFFDGKLAIATAPAAAVHARALLAWARATGVAVIHVRNVTKPGAPLFAPGSRTTAFAKDLGPIGDERVLTKPTGGAFTHTDLDALLRAQGIDTVVVAGIMSHLAVAITAQDAAVLGYHVVVASDATTSRALPGAAGAPPVDAATVTRVSLAIMADRVADVLPTDEIRALPIR